MLEGTHESVYEYDGASRRVRIKELTSGVETKNETFVWCGSRLCQKRASNGSTLVRSYFGNGFEESGTTDYFYTRDHLRSVREVVGSDGTMVASRLSYDPWGKVTETGVGAKSDFTYTGHYFDRATGLSLAQYRGYDAGLGRWISRDPMGIAGGLNLYGYVGNSPVNYIDQDGRFPVPVLFAGVALFAVYLALNSPTHDGSVVAGAPIMAAPAVGWAAGGALAGTMVPTVIGPTAGGLTASQRDSLNSWASRLAEHQAKLNAYRANPDAFDNKGFLKNAPTPEIRQSIIDGRIRHLEGEIQNFENEIERLKSTCGD